MIQYAPPVQSIQDGSCAIVGVHGVDRAWEGLPRKHLLIGSRWVWLMMPWRWFQWSHVSHFDALCGEILPLAHQVVARDVGNWEFHPSLLRERLHDNYDDTGSRHIREHMLSGWWLWLSGVGGRRIIWIMKIMSTHLQHRYTCRGVDTTTIGHNSDPLPRFGDIKVWV